MSKCRKVDLPPIPESVSKFKKALKDDPSFRPCIVVGDHHAVIFALQKTLKLLSTVG